MTIVEIILICLVIGSAMTTFYHLAIIIGKINTMQSGMKSYIRGDLLNIDEQIDSLRKELTCEGHKLTFVEKYEIDLSESAGTITTIYTFKCILCHTRINKTEDLLTEADLAILTTLGVK